MRFFWLLLTCAAGMALAQDAYPGQAIYHYGWYNAADAGLLVLAVLQRGRTVKASTVALFGAAIVVFAGVASGLLGPDTQTVIGAPGASLRSDDAAGTFVFPLSAADSPVQLQQGNRAIGIGAARRYAGSLIMWQQPRTVVEVDAGDTRGNHLTVTQPTNASFLSPVLLMQQTTKIAGMDVRFDTFSLPAERRNIKAVLFTEQQAAQLRSTPPIVGRPALLFAVSDSSDRVVPHGIGLAASGERKLIGGVFLRGTVMTYPAVVVAAAPYLPVLILGVLLLAAGAFLSIARAVKNPSRSRN